MAFSLDPLPDQSGRTVVITGANAGLGFHNAKDLAKAGATVVMACRSAERADAARARILDLTPDADVRIELVDMSSLASVRSFAEAFRAEHDTLDVLINNAGIMGTPYRLTEDGFEGQMAANYWGHFLLTSLLFDLLPDDPASRVVTLSSIAHINGRIRWDDLNWEADYDPRRAYAQTKLACLMFALELDRRLRDDGRSVRSVASHPGVSLTELAKTIPSWQIGLLKYTVGPFVTHPPDKASLPTLVAALDPDREMISAKLSVPGAASSESPPPLWPAHVNFGR